MNDVTTKKEAQTPSTILFRDDAHKGFENVRQESLALPILKLLQNGSGEAQKRNQNYVEGAEPGMFLNIVTKKLYDGDKGITVIPCYYKMEYQEWAEFGTGSGRPEQIYPADSDIKIKLSVSLINFRFFLFAVEKIYRGKLKTFDNLCSTLLKNFGISLNSTIETL